MSSIDGANNAKAAADTTRSRLRIATRYQTLGGVAAIRTACTLVSSRPGTGSIGDALRATLPLGDTNRSLENCCPHGVGVAQVSWKTAGVKVRDATRRPATPLSRSKIRRPGRNRRPEPR